MVPILITAPANVRAEGKPVMTPPPVPRNVDGTARDVIPVPVVPDKMAVPAPTVNDEIRVPDAPEGLPPGSAGEHKIPEPERKAVTPPPAAGY